MANQPLDLNQIQSGAFPQNNIPTNIGTLIGNVLIYVFAAGAIALLFYLILGGFQLMLSRGDPKAMQGAQSKITNALIGFVIIIIAFFIVQLLGQLLGLQTNTYFQRTFGL
jgi:hypothetical protein